MTATVLTHRRARLQSSPLRHVDLALILPVLIMSFAGLVTIYSATRTRLEAEGIDPYYFVKRQGIAIAIGIAVMVAVMAVDYRRLREFALVGYLGTIGLLGLVLVAGTSVKGAQARFDLGPFQLQPGEFVKFFLILVLAGYCSMHRGDLDARRLAVALGIAALPMGMIILQPDLGTDLVLGAITFAILAVGGAKARHLAILGLCLVTAAYAAIQLGVLEDYQVERLTSFTDQTADVRRAGYNQTQSKIAIGNGGLTGQGLFEGSQTSSSYVPEQHTDFIFTAVGEELGFVGAATLLALFALVVWRCWRTACVSNDFYGTLCCIGVVAMFGFQVFENVGMTMGIMPITGIPLPFVSYGGSSVIVSFACIGLVANVHMRRFT